MRETIEKKINFRDYMLYVRKRRLRILLSGLVFAVIFAGLIVVKFLVSRDAMIKDYNELMAEYDEDYAIYEETLSAVSYGYELSKDRLKHESEYMSKSIKLTVNPYNVLTVKTNIVITGNDGSDVSDIDGKRTLKSYYDNLYDYADWDSVGELLHTDGIYVKEIVDCSIDYDSMMINLSVMFPEEGYSQAITDMLINYADNATDMRGYHISVSNQQTEYVVDMTLNEYISERWEAYELLEESVRKGEKAVDDLEDSEPEKPSNEYLSKKHVLVKALIIGIIGFIIGCMAALILYYERYLYKGIICSADEFNRLTDIYTLEEIEGDLNDEKIYDRIRLYINRTVDGESVLVTGEKTEKNSIIVSKLNEIISDKKFVFYDTLKSNDALEKLYEAEGVIFIVEREKTTLGEVMNMKKTVEENDNKVIGNIVL